MFDLKTLNDFENTTKDLLKSKKIKFKESIQIIDKNIKINYITKTFLTYIVLFYILLSPTLPMDMIGLLIHAIVQIFLTIKNKKLTNQKTFLNESHKGELLALDETIDACELLKRYVRYKKLSAEELQKIQIFLSLYFPQEISDLLAIYQNDNYEQNFTSSRTTHHEEYKQEIVEPIQYFTNLTNDDYGRKLKR